MQARDRAMRRLCAILIALAGGDDAGNLKAQETAQTLEEVVVTGTRIRRFAEEFATPIVTLSADSIERSGRTNVAELLSKSPALLGSPVGAQTGGSRSDSGEAGLNILNLRNLGTDRTLVLVDGRRHVSSRVGSAAVDVNSIPTDLIEAVDVLTGGASAIYGADGVSGVVNFRLKKDFEGLSVRGQAGVSRYGDGRNQFAAATWGHNFVDSRGNAALAVEYNSDARVDDQRRPFLSPPSGFLLRNQNDIPDDPAIPDYVPYYDLRYADTSRNGAVDTNFDELPDFEGGGRVYDRGTVLRGSFGITSGGSSTPIRGYFGDLFPSVKRVLVNGLVHFDVSERVTLFAEAKLAEVRARTLSRPTSDFLQFVAADNPFLPQAIRDAIVPGAAADYFGDPAQPDGVLVSRDNYDSGINTEEDRRRTVRSVVGANGKLSDHLRYEVSYVFGTSNISFDLLGDRIAPRWLASIDAVTDPATGQPTCRSSLSANADPLLAGCIPFNLFGENVGNPAAAAWFNTTSRNRLKLMQQVLSGSVSGDLGEFPSLPGRGIEYALGAEFRRETSNYIPDGLISQNLTWNGPLIAQSGSFNVKEVFAEANWTLFKDRPGLRLWTVGAAARLSDYSSVGHTSSWKLDSVYSPLPGISFRGTLSQAVRAPNIAELYRPQTETFQGITDPCDINELNNGSATRAANCAVILQALGIDPSTFEPSASPQASFGIQGIVSGNANLREESARTWTAGFVWKPQFLPQLTLTADWYHIKISRAINTAAAEQIINLCVDQPTTGNPFCADVTRDPSSGFINGFTVQPQNVASFKTDGFDVVVNYSLATAHSGTFTFNLVGGHVNGIDFVTTPGGREESSLDQEFYPRNSAVLGITWQRKPVTLSYSLDWFSRTKRYSDAFLAGDPDAAPREYLYAKPSWEQNVQFAWQPSDRISISAGVNNLFNAKPEFGYRSYPVSGMGRFFYAGAKAHFR